VKQGGVMPEQFPETDLEWEKMDLWNIGLLTIILVITELLRGFFGLSDFDGNTNYNTIDYGFYFYRDSVKICENGTFWMDYVSYSSGDIFKISRVNDSILYMLNNDTIRTVFADTTDNLMADVSLYNYGAYFDNIFTSFCTLDMKLSSSLSIYNTDSLRILSLSINNGIPPYSYAWSNSDTTSEIKASTGIYYVTVTDDWGDSFNDRIDVTEDVLWYLMDSCSMNSDTLFCDAAQAGWHAGAISRNILNENIDGFLEYIITDESFSNHKKFIGLSNYNAGYGMDSIKYAFYFNGGSVYTYEFGIQSGSYGTYNTGDIFRIERVNDSIYYQKNDTILRSVYSDSDNKLIVDISFDNEDDYIKTVSVSFPAPVNLSYNTEFSQENNMGITVSPFGGVPPYTFLWSTEDTLAELTGLQAGRYNITVTDALDSSKTALIILDAKHSVIWTDVVGCDIAGDTIIKTTASSLWNAGASSINILPIGTDGFVEYVISEKSFYDNRNFSRAFGLSDNNYDEKLDSINFAICLFNDSVRIYESGIDRGHFGNYHIGDIFQVVRNGDTIFYLKNNIVMRQLVSSSSQELLVDVSIADENAYLENLVVSYVAPMEIFYEITRNCSDIIGTISVTIERGIPPYNYQWSTSATDTTSVINYNTTGTYNVTVSDSTGVIKTKSISVLFPTNDVPIWTNIDSLQITGDSVICINSLYDWNGGVSSANILSPFENGILEYYVSQNAYSDNITKSRYIGLSDRDINTSYSTIDYAFFLDHDTLKIAENGNVFVSSQNYNSGDRLQIIRNNDTIYYKKNNDTLKITNTDPARELMADISLKDENAYFDNIKVSFCSLPLALFSFDVQKSCNETTGKITTIVQGGNPPYNYQWNPGGASDTLPYYNFSSSGVKYITVTDSDDSTIVASVNVSTANTLSPILWHGLTIASIVMTASGKYKQQQIMFGTVGHIQSMFYLLSRMDICFIK
jgi:hypothetical protein